MSTTRRAVLRGVAGASVLGTAGPVASANGRASDDGGFERVLDREREVGSGGAARRGDRVFVAWTLDETDGERDTEAAGDLLLAGVDPADGTIRTATHATEEAVTVREVVATSDRLFVFCERPTGLEWDVVYAFRSVADRVGRWEVPRAGVATRPEETDAWALGDRLVQVSSYSGVASIAIGVDVRDPSGKRIARAEYVDRRYHSAFLDDGTPYLVDGDAIHRVDIESAALERVQSIDADSLVPTDGGFLGVAHAEGGFEVRPYDDSWSPAGEWRWLATGLDHRTLSLADATWTGDAVVLALSVADVDDPSSRAWLGAVEDGRYQPWQRTFADGRTVTDVLALDRGYLLAGQDWSNGWLLGATGPPDHSAGLATPTEGPDATETETPSGPSDGESATRTGPGPVWTVGQTAALAGFLYGLGRRVTGDRD